jgi:pyruvate-ferredoxin/flavodoxin oxidoreductase
MQDQKAAVNSGQWLLYRFDPRRTGAGENPLQLDSRKPAQTVEQYLMMENRFKMLTKSKPEQAKILFRMAQEDAESRFKFYEYMAGRKTKPDVAAVAAAAAANPSTTVTA